MYKNLFQTKISELKENGNYREFTEVNRVSSKYPLAKGENGQEIIVFCSNDYVSLKAIMERVGHTDHKTTLQIYSHVTEQMDKDMMSKLEAVGR